MLHRTRNVTWSGYTLSPQWILEPTAAPLPRQSVHTGENLLTLPSDFGSSFAIADRRPPS
jgi:hypothetical protein